MLKAHLDFEWRSAADIRKVGLHKQMEHPSTAIWCAAWRIGNKGLVNLWRPGDADPLPLLEHVAAGGIVCTHNTSAERVPWNNLLRRRVVPHWPEMKIEQMNCTMARCSALAIPPSLEMAAIALGLQERKDTDGSKLMKKMAKPRKVVGDEYVWWDAPNLRERLYAYCIQDVITETAIDEAVPELSPRERAVWLLNQRVNERGVLLDLPLVRRAIEIVEHAKADLDHEMRDITNGFAKKCSEVAKIAQFLTARGVFCTTLAKDAQEDLLIASDEVDDDVCRRVIELRRAASKTSTAKLPTMLEVACNDGRARGLLFYHGASTGRESGRLIQPQNLYRTDPERDGSDIEMCVRIMQNAHSSQHAYGYIDAALEDPMTMIAKCMRSMIIASPGKRFLGVDLSNIEGRGAAWLAGEDWKLQAFREYDAGTGPDLYKRAYSESFGVPVDQVKGPQRQIGKVEELALGYQGSVGAFINMGKNYGLKPAALVEPVRGAVSIDEWFRVIDGYKSARNKHGLPADQWTACKLIVNRWRDAHPNIVQAWWDLQDAAIEAVATPNCVVRVLRNKVAYLCARGFLWCALPNDRVLAYCRPRIVAKTEYLFREIDGTETWIDNSDCRTIGELVQTRTKRRVDYEGYDAGRWTLLTLYGGMQFNHIVQGFSRDVMFEGAFAAEAAGYTVVLDVHDELLTECGYGMGSEAELAALISNVPAWAQGLPLSAKAWEDVRYAK